MSKENVTMSDIAKELGVSRAYISMIASGKRKPNKDFVNKLENLGVTTKLNVNKLDTNSLTLNQQVTGSTPVRLRLIFPLFANHFGNILATCPPSAGFANLATFSAPLNCGAMSRSKRSAAASWRPGTTCE